MREMSERGSAMVEAVGGRLCEAEARRWVSWSEMLQWRCGEGRLEGPLNLRSMGARESWFGGRVEMPPGISSSLLMRRRTADGEREWDDGPSERARAMFSMGWI